MSAQRPGPVEVLPERTEAAQPPAPRPETRPAFLRGLSLAEVNQIGKMAALAGMFGKDLEAKSQDEIEIVKARGFMKVLAGVEIGLPIVQALGGIDIIDGRVSMRSTLMAQLLKRTNKYRYEVSVWDEEQCVLTWYERVDGEWRVLGPSSFTADEARKASLIDNPRKPTWRLYRKSMLMNRAIAQGARAYCADALGGSVYDPEELEPVDDLTDEERDYVAHAEKVNRGSEREDAPTAQPASPDEPTPAAVVQAPATASAGEGEPDLVIAQPGPEPASADAPPPLHTVVGEGAVGRERASVGQVAHLRNVAAPFKGADLKRLVAYATRNDGQDATNVLNQVSADRCKELCRFFERANDADREALSAAVVAWEQDIQATAITNAESEETVAGEVIGEGQERLL